MMVALAVVCTLGVMSATGEAHGSFAYHPSGSLEPGSGRGRVDNTAYVPDMRFPIQNAPAFANSQVHRPGGYILGGSQCDSSNYSYPWRDNYCETRTHPMPLCPSGTGHQGQDIRASTCADRRHPVVATVDGTITGIGSYSVSLTSSDGTTHRFLHMRDVAVRVNQRVTKGTVLGKVSNNMGSTPTTIHLHYDLRRNGRYISPYMSLVQSYQRLLGGGSAPAPQPQPSPQPSPAPQPSPQQPPSGGGTTTIQPGGPCSLATPGSPSGPLTVVLAALGAAVLNRRSKR